MTTCKQTAQQTEQKLTMAEELGMLSAELSMLTALLQNTCGERAEGFDTMLDNDRSWYLLHCAQMASVCQSKVEELIQIDHAAMTGARLKAAA